MNAVLQQINTVPGVMGSLVCDEEGIMVAHSFPPLFDSPMLQEAAALIGECSYGLQSVDGTAKFLDLRFPEGRILIKPIATRFLLLFCQKTVNLQFLSLTLKVAIRRMEKLLVLSPQPAAAPSYVPPSMPLSMPFQAPFVLPQAAGGKGVLLALDVLASSGGTYWDQMLETVAVNQATAMQISNHFKTGRFKKIKLTNQAAGISKVYPVRIIVDDKEHLYDGKIIVSMSVEEHLKAKPGDLLVGELSIGGGVFGWEGI